MKLILPIGTLRGTVAEGLKWSYLRWTPERFSGNHHEKTITQLQYTSGLERERYGT
jgi:hypothetical protein